MTFKELVASFNQQETTWEELCLEIRCESCFASVFDEVNEQMGSASDLLAQLADEFPITTRVMPRREASISLDEEV